MNNTFTENDGTGTLPNSKSKARSSKEPKDQLWYGADQASLATNIEEQEERAAAGREEGDFLPNMLNQALLNTIHEHRESQAQTCMSSKFWASSKGLAPFDAREQ